MRSQISTHLLKLQATKMKPLAGLGRFRRIKNEPKPQIDQRVYRSVRTLLIGEGKMAFYILTIRITDHFES